MLSGLRQIVPGVFQLSLGVVNVFLLVGDDGATVVDAGVAGSHIRILRALAAVGRQPDEVGNILISHGHADHAGGLAALRRVTGAQVWMHAADARLVRRGLAARCPSDPAAGLLDRAATKLVVQRFPVTVTPAAVDHELEDEDVAPVAGGVTVIHTPGHTAGHLSFLLPAAGGVLLAGDAAAHVLLLRPSVLYENRALGIASLRKLARQDFQVACFAHGWPIRRSAAERFRERWGSANG